MKYTVIFFFIIIAVSCFAEEHKVIKMGYRTTEKLPYINKMPDNEGYFKDLYSEAARRIGYKLAFVRLPKIRVLRGLANGTIDFYPGFSFNQERAAYSYWISTGRLQRDVAVSLEGLKELKSEKDLAGLNQLVALGNPDYVQHFDKTKFQQHIVPELDIKRALHLIKLKRADFYIYEEDALKFFIKEEKIKGYKFHANLIHSSNYESAGFSRRSPIFLAVKNEKFVRSKPLAKDNLPEKPMKGSPVYKFEAAMKAMIKEGVVQKIYKKHFE